MITTCVPVSGVTQGSCCCSVGELWEKYVNKLLPLKLDPTFATSDPPATCLLCQPLFACQRCRGNIQRKWTVFVFVRVFYRCWKQKKRAEGNTLADRQNLGQGEEKWLHFFCRSQQLSLCSPSCFIHRGTMGAPDVMWRLQDTILDVQKSRSAKRTM